MFYIVFLLSNFLALGLGVWMAIRHGELLRHEAMEISVKRSASRPRKEVLPVSESENRKEISDGHASDGMTTMSDGNSAEKQMPTDDLPANRDEAVLATNSLADSQLSAELEPSVESQSSAESESQETPAQETQLPEQTEKSSSPKDFDESKHSEAEISPRPLLPSCEMIEQVVGMIEEDHDSDELKAIASRLQEIYEMVATTDRSCYVSEDVEAFVTTNEEKYATTAICRPMVGRK